MKKISFSIIFLLLSLAGCASSGGNKVGSGIGASYTPVIDMDGVDKKQYIVDLFECRELAQQVEDNRESEILGKAIAGALIGSMIGSSGGDSGRRSGAKTGAVFGAGSGAGYAYQGGKDVIMKCLLGRGYAVLD